MQTDDKELSNNTKLLMEASRRIVTLSDQLIQSENLHMKLKVMLDELEPKYGKLKIAFDELIALSIEYRERLGYNDSSDFEYDQYEKAGLL